jgi:regulator of cell morphogenesis and NO signaling
MMTINTAKTVREFAVELPGATRVFERLGIDYCCGGDKALQEACLTAGVPTEKVVALLEVADNGAAGSKQACDWNSAPLSDLVAYIVTRHHVFTRKELPRLDQLLEKVCSLHGENHAELRKIQVIFQGLEEELTGHMSKEEQILFPYIKNLETAVERGESAPAPFFGTVRNPVRMMMQEHDNAGKALRGLREVSSNYRVPADGCTSFHTLYKALEEFEKDLHQHIHLENNILFPRAAELEANA